MGLPKTKINSNIAHKLKKWLSMDKLHVRQNGFLLQLQAIYALHCSFAILFFLLFCFLKPHFLSLLFFFLLFCSVVVKAMGINYSLPSTKNEVHDADLSHLRCHKIIKKTHTHTKTNKQE